MIHDQPVGVVLDEAFSKLVNAFDHNAGLDNRGKLVRYALPSQLRQYPETADYDSSRSGKPFPILWEVQSPAASNHTRRKMTMAQSWKMSITCRSRTFGARCLRQPRNLFQRNTGRQGFFLFEYCTTRYQTTLPTAESMFPNCTHILATIWPSFPA